MRGRAGRYDPDSGAWGRLESRIGRGRQRLPDWDAHGTVAQRAAPRFGCDSRVRGTSHIRAPPCEALLHRNGREARLFGRVSGRARCARTRRDLCRWRRRFPKALRGAVPLSARKRAQRHYR